MLSRLILAAAAASFPVSALAADATSPNYGPGPTLAGDLSVAVGGVWADGSYGYSLFDTLGRVNTPLGGNWNLEVEATGAAIFDGGSSAPAYVDALAHLWGTHSSSSAWGFFGGGVFGYGSILGIAGAEAKHFLTGGSLGGSAAVIACTDCGYTLGAFAVSYNHYFNSNHRIGLRGAILTDFSSSVWELTADAEHRFAHPVSLFVAATYTGGDGGPSAFWTARGGVRFYLDGFGDTLQSHERQVPWTAWIPDYFAIAVP